MPGLDALSVRDLVALSTICARMVGGIDGAMPDDLVAHAFAIADAFVERSEGRWANGARQSHLQKAEDRKEGSR